MNSKLQQIHYARAMKRSPDEIVRDVTEAAITDIHIQMLQRLMNFTHDFSNGSDDEDAFCWDFVLEAMQCTREEFEHLRAVLNS